MNFFHSRPPRAAVRLAPEKPAAHAARPHAVWTRDPKTGRPVQSWREADDKERSCTARPGGPPFFRMRTGGLGRAA